MYLNQKCENNQTNRNKVCFCCICIIFMIQCSSYMFIYYCIWWQFIRTLSYYYRRTLLQSLWFDSISKSHDSVFNQNNMNVLFPLQYENQFMVGYTKWMNRHPEINHLRSTMFLPVYSTSYCLLESGLHSLVCYMNNMYGFFQEVQLRDFVSFIAKIAHQ